MTPTGGVDHLTNTTDRAYPPRSVNPSAALTDAAPDATTATDAAFFLAHPSKPKTPPPSEAELLARDHEWTISEEDSQAQP